MRPVAQLGVASATGELDPAGRVSVDEVYDHVGVRVQVAVRDPGTIERSAGKMRRVVDQRNR
jgi:phenylacetate-CoA ligase